MSRVNTVKSGRIGENKAVRHLRLRGYKILERNYRCRFGEIDIICEKGATLVFAEVKMRASDAFGGGAAAVDRSKREKIIKTAQVYLTQKDTEREIRFDVIEINGGRVNHIKDAFYS